MGQNAELDAGSHAVGGTVSLPLGSFLLRCLRYILENWPVHSFNPAPWSKLPGVSAGGRDAQGLIWVCALIQGVASGSARSPGGAEVRTSRSRFRVWGHPRHMSAHWRASSAKVLSHCGSGKPFSVCQLLPTSLVLALWGRLKWSLQRGGGSMWLNHVDSSTADLPTATAECPGGHRRPMRSPSMAPFSRGVLMITKHFNYWIGTVIMGFYFPTNTDKSNHGPSSVFIHGQGRTIPNK